MLARRLVERQRQRPAPAPQAGVEELPLEGDLVRPDQRRDEQLGAGPLDPLQQRAEVPGPERGVPLARDRAVVAVDGRPRAGVRRPGPAVVAADQAPPPAAGLGHQPRDRPSRLLGRPLPQPEEAVAAAPSLVDGRVDEQRSGRGRRAAHRPERLGGHVGEHDGTAVDLHQPPHLGRADRRVGAVVGHRDVHRPAAEAPVGVDLLRRHARQGGARRRVDARRAGLADERADHQRTGLALAGRRPAALVQQPADRVLVDLGDDADARAGPLGRGGAGDPARPGHLVPDHDAHVLLDVQDPAGGRHPAGRPGRQREPDHRAGLHPVAGRPEEPPGVRAARAELGEDRGRGCGDVLLLDEDHLAHRYGAPWPSGPSSVRFRSVSELRYSSAMKAITSSTDRGSSE